MKDFSNKEHVTYDDCQECIYDFGEHKKCLKCDYYTACMCEKEIADFERQQSQALDSYLSRLENGELL